ncbi:unnamed protein product [Chrysoparadoxa australica]
MISFLLQDGVCQVFIGFITGISEEDGEKEKEDDDLEGDLSHRPNPGDAIVTEDLIRSYRAARLLASDEPTEALLTFLKKKALVITAELFKVFWRGSKGSFHHTCWVLDRLARHHSEEVFGCIFASKEAVNLYLRPMLRWVEHPPVGETLTTLVTAPFATWGSDFRVSPELRSTILTTLGGWPLLKHLADHISSTHVTSGHASGCADLLLDLAERLAVDEDGELLLEPISTCPEVVSGLAAVMTSDSYEAERRTDAARALLGLLHQAAEDKIASSTGNQQVAFPAPTSLVDNKLAPLRESLHELLQEHIPQICEAVVGQEVEPEGGLYSHGFGLVCTHQGYVVERPFSLLRILLIRIMVEMVVHSPQVVDLFPMVLWKTMCGWFFQYPHNNMYQGSFYKLLFTVLRNNNEAAIRATLSKCRLLVSLADTYMNGEARAPNRGFVLRLCNAIRLQAETLPPGSYLRNFLNSHDTWRAFLPILLECSMKEGEFGMGFAVPSAYCYTAGGAVAAPHPERDAPQGIDHGSRYAQGLGFAADIQAWPIDPSAKKSRRRKSSKGKKKGSSATHQKVEEERNTEEKEGEEKEQHEVPEGA